MNANATMTLDTIQPQFTYETPNVVSTGIAQFTYETPNVVTASLVRE